MKNIIKYILSVAVMAAAIGSCTKMQGINILNTGNFRDTTGSLKEASDIPIGAAISYTPMINDPMYASVVKRDFDAVTFDYNMKHGSIVQNNGTLNFTNADALVNAASGLEIFGHALGWHQNQNANYLKSFAGITVAAATELIQNGGFESGLSGWSTFNSGNPSGNATITAGSGASEVRTGTGSLKVINPTAYPGNQFRVQVSSSAFPTVSGKQYVISYWVKAASAGGSIRLSSGPTNAQYQGDQTIGTAFQQVSWTITANLSSTTFLFDMGQAANTYYIDDVSVKEVIAAPSGAQIGTKLDEALGNFITNTVTHFKGKVKAWDVINELFADNGTMRNNTNTPTPTGATDYLVWSEYLGRDYALKAFNYAKAADPAALLFINDYSLESNNTKLDSLIAFVKELKAKGAKVDGIGTQMHVNWNSAYTGIDNMMKKLAATGLLIRISELDVKINPIPKLNFVLSPTEAAYQADMYRYIIKSYMTNIPKAQQSGITIWGVTDNTSWLYNNGRDFPLLYNANYSKKPAYSAVLQALKGQ